MKYTIIKRFSLLNKKFDVLQNAELVTTVAVKPSKEYKQQYNLKFSNDLITMKECFCLIGSRHYFIYSINKQTNERALFGQLSYEISNFDYLYTIIIQEKLYKIRSTDLKSRRLTIIDSFEFNENQTGEFTYPETLFQSNDLFEKSNEKYHVNIHDKQWPLGYFAITILLHLHESQRENY